jgi:hypothetical protein
MNDEQPTDEQMAMAEAAAAVTRMAHDHGAGALVLHPYAGPPPPADFFLSLMREMIEADGDAMGCITIGCENDETGMLPLIDVHPTDALHAILHARMEGLLPKINWVTLAVDTYVFLTDDPVKGAGSARDAFQAGDPDAHEALVALCVAPDGPGYDVHQTYERDGALIEWGEPDAMQALFSSGDVPFLMNELVLV